MKKAHLNRRGFLRWVGIAAGVTALNACAPQVINQEEREISTVESPIAEDSAVEKPPAMPKEESLPEAKSNDGSEAILKSAANEPFLMPIEDIYVIKGRGVVVTGKVERGILEPNSEVEIIGAGSGWKTTVTGIEKPSKIGDTALPGENVGLLLRGVNREDLQVGMVVVAPGSIEAFQEFSASLHLLTAEDGGLVEALSTGYRTRIRIRTLVTGSEIELLGGIQVIQPGASARVDIKLDTPAALEIGTDFFILEKDRLIGSGVVTSLQPSVINSSDDESPGSGELARMPFLMPIEGVFSIKGRGTIVTGMVVRGTLEVGNQVEILGGGLRTLKTTVTGIEKFKKTADTAFPSEAVGLQLRGIGRDELRRGQVVVEPGSMAVTKSFTAKISVRSKEDGGGREVITGYRPQIYIWTLETTGEITLLNGIESIAPGESGEIHIQLMGEAALDIGVEIILREGGRTVGTGVVTAIQP